MKSAIEEATINIDFTKIGKTIAAEITRQVTKVVVNTIREACVETVVKIKGLSSYNDDDKAERKRIEAEFK
jgi:hypothetical protein